MDEEHPHNLPMSTLVGNHTSLGAWVSVSTKLGGQAKPRRPKTGSVPECPRAHGEAREERERDAETGDASVPTPLRELSNISFFSSCFCEVRR